jgi:hypothetical protein
MTSISYGPKIYLRGLMTNTHTWWLGHRPLLCEELQLFGYHLFFIGFYLSILCSYGISLNFGLYELHLAKLDE